MRIGRFVLREVLGRGAQAVVWRAHDERLDRDVALKLLEPGAGVISSDQWLHEARAVGRMAHPNIVPVFEADDSGGRAYLVFELVRGKTLADALRGGGAMPARAAVASMLGVIDALRTAHAQGIVHRDLKPSNILVDTDGRPRVMDFGIAARVDDQGEGRICGTPGYMSPEAARGFPPAPAMDIFSAGLILGEMLCGTRLLQERDPMRALRRVIDENLKIPEGAAVDDALRAIVHRAIARDPAHRFTDVAALQCALADWLGTPEASTRQSTVEGSGTLDFLLRRMRQRSDFPALSDAVLRIQRVASSESENLNSLAGEILKDVALTHKLLRLVNSAQFRHAGGGTISTVSRAIALVGFAGVRNLALSLVLLEHMQDKQHAHQLKEQFLCALMAGQVASEMTGRARDSEESYLGAMMQNLGRLLTEFYLPEEARVIREEMRPHVARAAPAAASVEQAARRVLGIGLQDLGLGVAKAWGLPETLQQCMRPPEGEPPMRRLELPQERMRWLARAANEIAVATLTSEHEALEARLGHLEQRYATALQLRSGDVARAVGDARRRLGEFAAAMGLQVQGSPAERLVDRGAAEPTLVAVTEVGLDTAAEPTAIDLDPPSRMTAPLPAPPNPARAGEMLSAGIQDITNTMAEESFRLNEVLRMVLETMYRALEFRHVVFCLRDPRSGALSGRFGLGDGVEAIARQFQVAMTPAGKGPVDLFAAVCHKGADMLIADADAPNIAPRLPAWFRQHIAARAFLLLPLTLKRAPFGLIYADRDASTALTISERELSLLRTLRNQAVMAFRSAG